MQIIKNVHNNRKNNKSCYANNNNTGYFENLENSDIRLRKILKNIDLVLSMGNILTKYLVWEKY